MISPTESKLRELLQAAAARPWRAEPDERSGRVGDPYTDEGWRDYIAGWDILAPDVAVIDSEGIGPGGEAEANLIVAAVNALEALLDERDALQKALEQATEGYEIRDYRGETLARSGFSGGALEDYPELVAYLKKKAEAGDHPVGVTHE